MFNVCPTVCPADRYLVNQRVSCPWSNSRRRFSRRPPRPFTRNARVSLSPLLSPFSSSRSLVLSLSTCLLVCLSLSQIESGRLIGIYRTCSCVHACKYSLCVERYTVDTWDAFPSADDARTNRIFLKGTVIHMRMYEKCDSRSTTARFQATKNYLDFRENFRGNSLKSSISDNVSWDKFKEFYLAKTRA